MGFTRFCRSSACFAAGFRLAAVLILALTVFLTPAKAFPTASSPPPPDPNEPYNQLPPPRFEPSHNRPDRPLAAARILDLTHADTSTAVHVQDVYNLPYAGTHTFSLPAMLSNLQVRADGAPLAYTSIPNPDNADTRVEFVVPPGVNRLVLTYTQTDGTVAYDGLWYLSFNWVWGPTTITIHLPEDAAIERYSDADLVTVIDTHTLRFDVPDGTPVAVTVVYHSGGVTGTYYTYTTPHFRVHLPLVYQPYAVELSQALEALYSRYSLYMGYDVNAYYHKDYFDYYFLPGGWNWWGTDITLSGGLCIVGGGPCAVNRWLVPSIHARPDVTDAGVISFIGHELGHGWQGIIGASGLPWWLNDGEGYPSFLNQHGLSDLGYCPASSRGYEDVYRYYQEYLSNPANRRDYASIVIESSLRKRYGWSWLVDIHSSILAGNLDLNGLTDQEKTDRMINHLSRSLGEDLTPFFDTSLIYAGQTVRDQLSDLPASPAAVQSQWPCPSGRIIPASTNLSFILPPGARKTISLGLTAELGQTRWTIAQPGVDWLELTNDSGLSTPIFSDPANLVLDTTGLSAGQHHTRLTITPAAPSLPPVEIDLTLTVGDGYQLMLPLVTR